MENLYTLTNRVKDILKENEDARNNVWELYYAVCKSINPNMLTSKFGTVIRSHDEYGLPPFESVARVRRKIVEEHPELKGCDDVEGGRWSSRLMYKEYARSKV